MRTRDTAVKYFHLHKFNLKHSNFDFPDTHLKLKVMLSDVLKYGNACNNNIYFL